MGDGQEASAGCQRANSDKGLTSALLISAFDFLSFDFTTVVLSHFPLQPQTLH